MRARLEQAVGLRGVIISGALGPKGVAALPLTGLDELAERDLLVTRGFCYRSAGRAAAAVWVRNSGTESWTVVGASLSVNGEPMKGVVWQGETIAPGETGLVVVEVDGAGDALRGDASLSLWEAGPRAIHLPRVTFP
jgi:uncharacterized protein (TIGR02268 family)